MAYHPENNTMDVVVDGVPCIREVHQIVREEITIFAQPRHFMNVYEPKVSENEVCNWTVGSDVPFIHTIKES